MSKQLRHVVGNEWSHTRTLTTGPTARELTKARLVRNLYLKQGIWKTKGELTVNTAVS
jgi:hypothetical protein